MTGQELFERIESYTDEQLRAAVERWFSLALDAFEGDPGPSEIEGKYLLSEMRKRGWEGRS